MLPSHPVPNGDSKYLRSASSETSHPQDPRLTNMNPATAKSMTEPSLRALHHSIDKPTHFSDFEIHLPAHLCLKHPKFSSRGLTPPGPNMLDTDATIIDVFSPRVSSFQLSPASSASSDMSFDNGRSSFDAFVETRSRVVRLMKFSRSPTKLLNHAFSRSTVQPVSLWCLRDDYVGERPKEDGIWAVFKTHEEACAALSLSGPSMSVVTAVETELEPFHKLQHFRSDASIGTASQPPVFYPLSPAANDIPMSLLGLQPECRSTAAITRSAKDIGEYTLSSNPPNPRVNFRLGDWICTSLNCAAHNFGRNLACIGCGSPRSGNGGIAPRYQNSVSSARALASPRFVSSAGFVSPLGQLGDSPIVSPSFSAAPYPQHQASPQQPVMINKMASPSHPLLTPSGRAFAVGGKVQNISSDPLSPCIVYWPDNEPLPEQGQIRPGALAGVPQPPILNTGNRGPIEHQPGDWICLKCNYLNWRRRKVCQTCYPYAEGNGDSISSAVQAERIALLTSVLAQSQMQASTPHVNVAPQPRSISLTHSHAQLPPGELYVSKSPGLAHSPRAQIAPNRYTRSQPIYQTSGYPHRTPSPDTPGHLQLHAPAPLLPSFLQDIVQSPTLSPTSTSSAELSLEEIEAKYHSASGPGVRPTPEIKRGPSSMALRNIWRMDGEETRNLSSSAFAPLNQEVRISRASP